MSTLPNLDDENQTVFYIPFTGDEGHDENHSVPLPQSLQIERGLVEYEHLRLQAYKEAWRKCLDRVKSIIRALHAPIVADVVDSVQSAYDNPLPGLPYPELPVICIKDLLSDSMFMDEVTTQLDPSDPNDGTLFDAPKAFTVHLYPSDCASLTSTMKSIISGFTDRPHILEKVKGRPAVSLPNYDLEMLCAWYVAVRQTSDFREENQTKLVVVLHDFEQLDPDVIQDLLSISSLYVTRLPLVFVLFFSSPASPSYLHVIYPRSILSLLRIRTFTAPSGPQVLEEILLETFFDVDFQPEVMIGPNVLQHLADYCTRQNPSLDGLLTSLHLAYLKHFSTEPTTTLVQSTPSRDVLARPTSQNFVEFLFARLQTARPAESSSVTGSPKQHTLRDLITTIDGTRATFHSRALRMRLGFGIMRCAQEFLESQGHKGLGWNSQAAGVPISQVMIDVMRGNLGPAIKALGSLVKKLRRDQLKKLLEKLHTHFDSMSYRVWPEEEAARAKIGTFINALAEKQDDGEVVEAGPGLASSFSEWLIGCLKTYMVPLEHVALWDIWYTGETEFPSELMNPSLRASLVSGLLFPHQYAEPTEEDDEDNQAGFALWEHPDTSILFRRYLDSGKMINVFDWFGSFQIVLERQRKGLLERQKKSEKGRGRGISRSPSKRGRKGKERDVHEDYVQEEDEDAWKLQIQARFMRALHELDHLGFIKHTGRKADHVLRTVFDLRD